jgi:hypothetical protein
MTRIEDGKPGKRGRRRLAQRRGYRRSPVGRKGPPPSVNAIPLAQEGDLKRSSPGPGRASRRQPTAPPGNQVVFHRAGAEGTDR